MTIWETILGCWAIVTLLFIAGSVVLAQDFRSHHYEDSDDYVHEQDIDWLKKLKNSDLQHQSSGLI